MSNAASERAGEREPVGVAVHDVHKAYDGVPALRGLDLEVRPAELLVLLGASGSGKSTALRVVAGLEHPSAGSVRIGGRDVTRTPPHRRDVAMVFQDYALYPHLSVAQNLAFGLRVRRTPVADVDVRVRRAADALGLGTLLDRLPEQLSGGQQQRVAVARAMVREPAVYLMDEPLSNLDAGLRLAAREEIVALHRRLGTTTVYVTHDQTEAMAAGDRVAVVHEGRVQQVGVPQEVYDRPATSFVARFLGTPPMHLVAGDTPTGRLLGGAPGCLVGVRPEDLLLDCLGPVEATVSGVESLGSEALVSVRCPDGQRLAVRTPPRSPHRPGDTVRLSVAAGRLHRFDEATGRRQP